MFRLATWNVHYSTPAGEVVDAVHELVKTFELDVLCLQEVCLISAAARRPTRLPGRLAKATGFTAVTAWQTTPALPWWEGLVVLSRFPVLRCRRRVFNIHRRYLEAQVDTPGGAVTIGDFHVSGWARPWKEREMAKVLGVLPEQRAVLAGDFNLRPADPLMRQAFERLVWDGSRLATNSKAKIDYVLATKDLRLANTRLLPRYASDHSPVMVEVS